MSVRSKRLMQMINLLSNQKEVSVNVVKETFEISEITLKRYLAELRQQGFVIQRKGAFLSMKVGGELKTSSPPLVQELIDYRILANVLNHQTCRRMQLISALCGNVDGKIGITERTLDKHLVNLCNQGWLEKVKRKTEVFYSPSQKILDIQEMDFKSLLRLINFLKAYGESLPYKDELEVIKEKLEINCLNSIRNSVENKEILLFTHLVFPECIVAEAIQPEEDWADQLEVHCRNGYGLTVTMKSKNVLELYPFLITFNWNNGCWYLVYRHISDEEGFDLLRVDNIAFIHVKPELRLEQERVLIEIDKAKKAISDSFELSTELECIVELAFHGLDSVELEEVNRRMRCVKVVQRHEINQDSIRFQLLISGTMDFLSWVRRFGSKVIIHNEDFRTMHYESASFALTKYQIGS